MSQTAFYFALYIVPWVGENSPAVCHISILLKSITEENVFLKVLGGSSLLELDKIDIYVSIIYYQN